MTVQVIIFAGPEGSRPEACSRLMRSLEESDVLGGWLVYYQPKHLTPAEHWKRVHEKAARVTTDLVLVLEDDVILNRHLIHNLSTWRWTTHKDFGAGWLWNPGGYTGKDIWYGGPLEWYGTCGVAYRPADLPRLVELAWPRIQTERLPWDKAMSWAVAKMGRRIRVHFPALVEHPDDVPSLIGSKKHPMRTSRGTFSVDFARPNGHAHGNLDPHGRRIA